MGVKLTRVEIHNYRSIFEEQASRTFSFELGQGMNVLLGRNNSGKSNVLKAIALALEEGEEGTFEGERDVPMQKLWARPTITLDFVVERPTGPEQTLLRYLENYERAALQEEKKATLAGRGKIRLRVKYTKQGRDEFFMTAAGGRRGTAGLNQRALDQFRRVVRFVIVRSGESIEDFLAGRFKDLLHTVLQENLAQEVQAAEERRQEYQSDIARSVFGPVAELVTREISQMIPEISTVELEPRVLGIDETLATAGITLVDGARTGLAEKGTGVRGSLLLAMLRYIAENSRRSVIFAVEEPEAFLHPAAQEEARDDLEALAERDDVTLLVTTHSPFVVSRAPKARLIAVTKDAEGRTRILDCCRGDEDRVLPLSTLFRDAVMPDFLERAASAPRDVRAFVVVEGYTDARYLALAAERCGVEATAGLEIVPAEGAKSAAVQAVVLRAAHGAVPVVVLLDFEPQTRSHRELLRNDFGFPEEAVLTYREWGPAPKTDEPVEAETLFPQAFVEAFLRGVGEDAVLSEKRRSKGGGWLYGLSQAGKERFLDYVERKAGASELEKFAHVWQAIQGAVAALEDREGRRAARLEVSSGGS